VEHIKLHDHRQGKELVVEFDFLGKDSIRYHNEVSIERPVFQHVKSFMQNKQKSEDLFDQLNVKWRISILKNSQLPVSQH